MKHLRVLVWLVCVYVSGIAQNHSLSFYSKNTQDGLSDNWVRCVYQDARGFMWFGTASGLNRYDGVNFKHYPLNYSNVNAIITKDSEHMLICTDVGAYVYNIYNHKFTYFDIQSYYPVLSVARDNDGLLWFATSGGLVRYSERDSTAQLYTHSEFNTTTLSNNYCNTVIVDDSGIVWVGTKNGLNKYKAATNTFLRYQTQNTPELQSNDVLALAVDYKHRLWVGTARGGVSVFNNSLSEILEGQRVFQGNVITICIDSKNNLWIGRGSGEGLQVINLKDYTKTTIPTPVHYKKNPLQKYSLSDNSIFHIYEDTMGDIWIGTFGGGVNYTSKRAKNFHIIDEYFGNTKVLSSNLVNCFFQDSNTLWIGTEAGIDAWNTQSNTFRSFVNIPGNNTSLQGNAVYAIYKDSHGTLWVGTWSGGLNKFNVHTHTFTHIPLGKNPVNNVFAIEEDKHENLWIGTIEPTEGLFRYNIRTGNISNYSAKRSDTTSLTANSVNDILVTQAGTVLISTFRSIEVYVPQTDNFIRIPLQNFSPDTATVPYISCLFEDSKGRILVGTNYGLLELDTVQKEIRKNQLFENFTNTIQGITEDKYGNIWITTLQGIKRFVANVSENKPRVVEHFTYHDGISGNETKPRSAYRNLKGYIFVGTSQGITYFHEDSIHVNTKLPRIEITDMLLLKYLPNENAEYIPINNTSFYKDTIVLDYTSTDFIIRYAALNYLVPQKNRYYYKLVGHDSEWIDAGTQTSVTYTNMQPGTYTFQVVGSNNDGIWNTEPAELTIVIKHPWWQTFYFKILLVLLVFAVVWGVIKIRVAMYETQQKILTRKVEERTRELMQTNEVLQEKQEEISRQNNELFRHRNELRNLVDERTADLLVAKQKAEESDRLKSAFLSNMSHEIRTPMNAIVGFSEMLAQDELNEEEKIEFVRVISESSKQLLRIVDDILDISRIETGSMSLNIEAVDLHDVMTEIKNFFEPQVRAKGIQFIQDIPSQKIVFEVDKTKLFQILTNLIGNALKFTQTGEIRCGYVIQENQIQFFVKDTGIGIPKRLHEKIFERFRQAELTVSRTYGGTGLGLAICKKLVELMSGTIWLESEQNIGSTFYFTLPYTPSQIKEKQKFSRMFSFTSKSKKTVLVAEDNDVNYAYLYQVLTRAKCTVIRANNGSEAVHICEKNPDIAMVLMDVRMPILDGLEAAKLILQQNPNLPILIQTAFSLTIHSEQVKQIGCVGIISKPIKRNELLRYISEYI